MAPPDLLWLLWPVAAAAGWYAARHSGASPDKAFRDYTTDLHAGSKTLLSEQQDKSSLLFNQLSGVDQDIARTPIGAYYSFVSAKVTGSKSSLWLRAQLALLAMQQVGVSLTTIASSLNKLSCQVMSIAPRICLEMLHNRTSAAHERG